jgi:SAM-dependent methyltransferase
MKCRICSNDQENRPFQVREMMYGSKELFDYFQCPSCGCLQIDSIPADIGRHYPQQYYASEPDGKTFLKAALAPLRDRYALFGRGLAGKLLCRFFPAADALRCLRRLDVGEDTRILDVGCNTGDLLYSIRQTGVRNLLGVDPFIPDGIRYDNGLEIRKIGLQDVAGPWDVVMLHHSFEHMPNPREVLGAVNRLLAPGGHCVIRIPVVSSYTWRHYGVDWVELDAPRHFFLYSRKSMEVLVGESGMQLWNVVCDSTAFEIWGSEQYQRDIPLMDERSYAVNPAASIFSQRQIAEYEELAQQLNADGEGGRAVFYLRKPGG